MELIVKAAALALTAALIGIVLRRTNPELSLLLSVSAVLLGMLMLLAAFDEVSGLGAELLEMTKLAPTLFVPLLKVMAIALIVRIGGALCADAGQSALSALLETAGAVCALWCAVPLLRAVVDMLEGWI